MNKRVVVWGTGNVGRPAIRAVLAHRDLDLVGVIVSNPAKVGRDAGELAGIDPVGLTATDDWRAVVEQDVDCIVYAANADTRGEAAFIELISVLAAGINVVSTAFYPLLYPRGQGALREAIDPVEAVCQQNNSSVFVSGIDPGWAMDILPVLLSGVVSDIEEIRMQEIFNYGLYDQPEVVREVIGFGKSMDELPRMLEDSAMKTVWGPMVQLVAAALDYPLDSIETAVERLPLEKDIDVPGMGLFEKGTQGAFRFEVRGMRNGSARIVVEHITRIDDDCGRDWPYPHEGRGCHQVIISGNPKLVVSCHGEDPVEPGPAGGGNCSAANRLVNAIPAVCAANPGILSPLDLPTVHGGAQLRV
ncbi:dihydrodipicolinate reductase [Parahaliea aestuarii]|uniref:Dihydrodipicolinate reductase n=1 Tax=Parahaliea aestuarii TaxID=1852021 RepID=A0A5C8ZSZ9_9GAMM|nr:dihydrodipicolinate reductase [Parahaliea aestuarii]TXS91638.1 dihydrodipicolinate reductase [Parahaliea aestuarii]